LSEELLATSPGILESGLQRAAHTDCTNAISMTANSKGGRFTNITTGTGGANTHIEPEPSALLVRAAMMVSREMGRFHWPTGTCLYRKLHPDVMMMKSTEDWL
jgi:hypothetical protein